MCRRKAELIETADGGYKGLGDGGNGEILVKGYKLWDEKVLVSLMYIMVITVNKYCVILDRC